MVPAESEDCAQWERQYLLSTLIEVCKYSSLLPPYKAEEYIHVPIYLFQRMHRWRYILCNHDLRFRSLTWRLSARSEHILSGSRLYFFLGRVHVALLHMITTSAHHCLARKRPFCLVYRQQVDVGAHGERKVLYSNHCSSSLFVSLQINIILG